MKRQSPFYRVNLFSRSLLAITFLVAAVSCLSSARRSLLEVGRPHDIFILSVLSSILLAMVLVSASLGCLIPSQSKFWSVPGRPWLGNMLGALICLGVSLLVIATETPTSFVSWVQFRGVPSIWLENGHFFGPCNSLGRMCRTYWPISLKPIPLLVNLVIFAVAIHCIRRLTQRAADGG
jgi:hypothetical protein